MASRGHPAPPSPLSIYLWKGLHKVLDSKDNLTINSLNTDLFLVYLEKICV